MPNPKVSVIIPTKNREEYVSRAVNSVLAQTFGDFEIIIISDGSTDNTDSVIRSYDDKRIIYLKFNVSKGAAAARNYGVRTAKGEYLAFLDDDDEWLPEKLAMQVDAMERSSPDVGLIYTWMDIYAGGKFIKRIAHKAKGDMFREMLGVPVIRGFSNVLIRKAVFDRLGDFDENLRRGIDSDMWRRIAKYYKVDYVPEALVKYDLTENRSRISSQDRQGLEIAIQTEKVKLEKFKEDYLKNPDRKAEIYAMIAYDFSKLDGWGECVKYFGEALKVWPYTAQVYLLALKAAAHKIKRTLTRAAIK